MIKQVRKISGRARRALNVNIKRNYRIVSVKTKGSKPFEFKNISLRNTNIITR